jgi:hypothetical protein
MHIVLVQHASPANAEQTVQAAPPSIALGDGS